MFDLLDFAESAFVALDAAAPVDAFAGAVVVVGAIGFGTVVWANAALAVKRVSAALSKSFFIVVPVKDYTNIRAYKSNVRAICKLTAKRN